MPVVQEAKLWLWKVLNMDGWSWVGAYSGTMDMSAVGRVFFHMWIAGAPDGDLVQLAFQILYWTKSNRAQETSRATCKLVTPA